jgi:hypothetical protein
MKGYFERLETPPGEKEAFGEPLGKRRKAAMGETRKETRERSAGFAKSRGRQAKIRRRYVLRRIGVV